MTGLNWYVGDLRTGRIYTQVPVIAGSPKWSIVMDGAGTFSVDIPMSDPAVQALNLRSASAVAKAFLAYAYVDSNGNEFFLDGGPIWTRNYDADTRVLTLAGSGLWSHFDHRKIMDPKIAPGSAGFTTTHPQFALTGWTLGTIASKTIQFVMNRTGATTQAGLTCIVYPADVSAPADTAHTRSYLTWDLNWLGQALDDLVAVIGGPEIAFRPRRKVADQRFLEWVMLTGIEADPLLHQTGSDWIWDGSLPKSPVSKVATVEDGTGMGDGAWAKGNGSAEATLMSYSLPTTLTDLGYPMLELEVTGHDDVEVQATLDGYTQQASMAGAHPSEALTFTVQRDTFPQLGMYAVGDYARATIPTNHPYLPGGTTFRSRITQLSGTDANTVDIQLQPIPGSL